MAVDESIVAFWNWTRISLAVEEEDEQEMVFDYSQDSDDFDTLLISICCVIGALLTVWVLCRYNFGLLKNSSLLILLKLLSPPSSTLQLLH